MGPGDVAVSFDTTASITHPQTRKGFTGPPSHVSGPGYRSTTIGPGSGPGGPGMPFMSFPLGDPQVSGFGVPTNIGGGFGRPSFDEKNFDNEPPLLEELGINLPQIVRKFVSVMNPFRINCDLHEDGDLSGPILFCTVFGLLQLLAGKVHFGIILGWASLSSLFLYTIFNLLVGVQPQSSYNLDLYRCCSIFGYSLLPIILFSALSLVLPHGNLALGVGAISVLWATRICSFLLVSLIPHAEDFFYLLAYACLTVFACFSLLVFF